MLFPLVAMAAAVVAIAPPAPGALGAPGAPLPERLIARPLQPAAAALRGAAPEEAAARAARARAAVAPSALAHFVETDEFVIPVPAGQTAAEAAARLMATGDFQYVIPDRVCYPVGEPADPLFASQWHHVTLGSVQAWEVTQGSEQIICAFMDTGVDLDHPDLAPRLVPGFNAVSDLPQGAGGDVSDINGHGTAVAGVAAAIGDNGEGVAGVGWRLRIMPVRVTDLPSGGAYLSDILQGARWAADAGARVISASYTGVSDPAVQVTGEYIRAAGATFLFAAGNDAANLDFDHPDVLVVGATDWSDALAGFSAYGRAIDLVAPGVEIVTTQRGGGYGASSGTSFSTPMANGVLGMILSVNPALTPAQAEAILLDSCDDLGPPGEDTTFGRGRVNLLRAVSLAAAAMGPSAPHAVPDRATAVAGRTQRIDVLANDFDVDGDAIQLMSVSVVSGGGSAAISAGTGPSGRDEVLFAAPASAGEVMLAYTIRDDSGAEDAATVRVEVLDPAALRPAVDPGPTRPGVRTRYFVVQGAAVLPDFEAMTPYASEIRADINVPSTEGAFAGSGRADEVGAVFDGFIRVPAPDVYTFATRSDDGSRLLIGDMVVVDNDGLHGMQERSGTVALDAGWHPIRVEFFEGSGGAGLVVTVAGGGMSKRVIPAAMFREGSCTGDWDRSGTVSSADISAFLARWVADVGMADAPADVNGDGAVNSTDISAFLSAWLADVGGC